jgi:hypothetical protein
MVRLHAGYFTRASSGPPMSLTGLFRERSLLRGCAKMGNYSTRDSALLTIGEPSRERSVQLRQAS